MVPELAKRQLECTYLEPGPGELILPPRQRLHRHVREVGEEVRGLGGRRVLNGHEDMMPAHAPELAQRRFDELDRDVFEHLDCHDEIERVVGKRQPGDAGGGQRAAR